MKQRRRRAERAATKQKFESGKKHYPSTARRTPEIYPAPNLKENSLRPGGDVGGDSPETGGSVKYDASACKKAVHLGVISYISQRLPGLLGGKPSPSSTGNIGARATDESPRTKAEETSEMFVAEQVYIMFLSG